MRSKAELINLRMEKLKELRLERVEHSSLPSKLKYPVKPNLLFYLQWHITDRCNFRCKHCYREDEDLPDMPTEVVLKVVDKYFDALIRLKVRGYVALMGGEPFIREDLFEILDYIYKYFKDGYPINVGFSTNGSLLTSDTACKLKGYQPMVSDVQVSLDGATVETNDSIRSPGSFEGATGALQLLNTARIPTAIHFVIHRLNAKETTQLVYLAKKHCVKRITISRFVPLGRGKAIKDLMLSPGELKTVWHELFEISERFLGEILEGKPCPLISRARCDLWHLTDPEYAVEICKQQLEESHLLLLGQRCPVGGYSLTLAADGVVFPCRRLPIPIGNVLKQNFIQILLGTDLLWKFRDRARFQKGRCRKCKFMMDPMLRRLCNGGAPCLSYACYGDYFMPDPQCWCHPEGGQDGDK